MLTGIIRTKWPPDGRPFCELLRELIDRTTAGHDARVVLDVEARIDALPPLAQGHVADTPPGPARAQASITVLPHSSLGYRPPAPESRRPCPLAEA